MSEKELVSIITPVYNKERFLVQSIDSVIKQTYEKWELILVDDCSTDNSALLIRKYLEIESRIKYYKLEENLGAAVARNVAIDSAKGRYIAFLDADDLWNPQKLSKQIGFMKKKNVGFSYTAIEMINENGQIVKGKRRTLPMVDYKVLLSHTIIACSSVIIDRQIIGEFRMTLVRKGQDFATWLSILKKGYKAYGINETLLQYRLAKKSISSNKLMALKRTWNIYRNVEKLGFFNSSYYFAFYTFNALIKYIL